MALITRASLPQEFTNIVSARLLLTPEPQYLHAQLFKMSLNASFSGIGSLGLPIPGRQFGTNGAAYASPTDGTLALSDGIYDQAIMVVPELGKGVGQTVSMNRPVYANTTYTQVSREVPGGTAISQVPINVGSEQVSITIRRFAGPYDPAQGKPAPYGVDRFDSTFMMHRAADIVSGNLKRDFDRTLDTFGVKLFDIAGTTVHPNGFTTDNDHTTVDAGPMSWALLQSVERQMDDASIPKFADGKRCIVLKPRQVEQLTLDPMYQRLARYFPAENPLFKGTYVSDVGDWKIFKSTQLTTVTNGSSVPVYYGQAFGPGAIGCGAGSMPECAFHTNDNYGLTSMVIWLWHAGFEVFDNRFIFSVRTS